MRSLAIGISLALSLGVGCGKKDKSGAGGGGESGMAMSGGMGERGKSGLQAKVEGDPKLQKLLADCGRCAKAKPAFTAARKAMMDHLKSVPECPKKQILRGCKARRKHHKKLGPIRIKLASAKRAFIGCLGDWKRRAWSALEPIAQSTKPKYRDLFIRGTLMTAMSKHCPGASVHVRLFSSMR